MQPYLLFLARPSSGSSLACKQLKVPLERGGCGMSGQRALYHRSISWQLPPPTCTYQTPFAHEFESSACTDGPRGCAQLPL